MEMSADTLDEDSMRSYLEKHQSEYYFDSDTYGRELGAISLIAISGPTAAGKSTLVRTASEMHDIAPLQSSMTRAMESRDEAEPYHRFSVPVKEFYDGVQNRSLVNYFVNRNNHIYGTFLSGFSAPITIGAIGTDTLYQLKSAGFRDVRTLYTVMSGEDYAARLGLDRIRQPDIKGRLLEGKDSLKFARDNLTFEWLTPIRLSNMPGELERAADDVGRITYHRTLEMTSNKEANRLIDEMDAVIDAALARLALQ